MHQSRRNNFQFEKSDIHPRGKTELHNPNIQYPYNKCTLQPGFSDYIEHFALSNKHRTYRIQVQLLYRLSQPIQQLTLQAQESCKMHGENAWYVNMGGSCTYEQPLYVKQSECINC